MDDSVETKRKLEVLEDMPAIDMSMNDGEAKLAYSKRAVEELSQTLGIEERGQKGVDLVIDASGAEVCIQMGIFLAKHGGPWSHMVSLLTNSAAFC